MAENTKPVISGEGTVEIKADALTNWIASQMPGGYFYNFERVKVDANGDLSAKYTYSNSAAPPPPPE